MNFPPLIKSLFLAVVTALIVFVIANFVDQAIALPSAIGSFIGVIVAFFFSSSSTSTNNVPANVKTLYVGNLPYRANEAAIRELFSQCGLVISVRLMKDKNTGKRRGFGFVEMAELDADKAIATLNDTEFQQRTLKIREAKERPEKNPTPSE